MSLVELLVGLALASIVAAIVMTGSVAVATHVRMGLAQARTAERLADAFAAIEADVRGRRDAWRCLFAWRCHPRLLPAGVEPVRWTVDNGLRRCRLQCEVVLDGIVGLDVLADVADADGVRRRRVDEGVPSDARLIEVRLRTRTGRLHSRVIGIP
ncbi:hypothetical protein KPL74_07410 [Bacillus sp. NP157]|nr:hypothetical protein KPL74_07410 [Bacillus sp. NP157]